jgi:hypothetical protein
MLFRSEEGVDDWCRKTGEPRGETLTLPQVWTLSRAWYEDRMDPTFRGRTPDQVRDIFARQGLTSDFWQP